MSEGGIIGRVWEKGEIRVFERRLRIFFLGKGGGLKMLYLGF